VLFSVYDISVLSIAILRDFPFALHFIFSKKVKTYFSSNVTEEVLAENAFNAPASRLKKSCRGGEKQFPAMRLVKLELEIFRWGLVVFRFGWCVSEAEGRRICATP